jgi:Bacterial Ig domain
MAAADCTAAKLTKFLEKIAPLHWLCLQFVISTGISAMRIVIMAVAAAVVLFSAAPAYSQSRGESCRVDRWSATSQNPDASTRITLSRDGSCTILVRARTVSERVVNRPRNGTVTFTPLGPTYRPRPGFVGEDSFMVEAMLPADDPAITQPRRTLTVSVTVQSDPMPPVAAVDPDWPACQVGRFEVGGTSGPVVETSMRLRANGRCSVGLADRSAAVRLDAQPQNGTVAIANGQAVYTPNRDFRGRDTFTISWPRPGEIRRIHVGVEVR